MRPNIKHASSDDVLETVNNYYTESYKKVHGTGSLKKANDYVHRKLEINNKNKSFPITLELGSGNFEHLPWVKHSFDKYICMDIRRPSDELMASIEKLDNVVFEIGDARRINLPDNSVDRIVVTCLLMHLDDPITAIKEWQRVCKPGGIIEYAVHTDPGIAVRLFRKLFSERAVRNQGLNVDTYRLVTAYEHVSSFSRLLAVSRALLEGKNTLKVDYYPFKFLKSFNLNPFTIFRIKIKE